MRGRLGLQAVRRTCTQAATATSSQSVRVVPPPLYKPEPHEEDARPIISKFWIGKNVTEADQYLVDCEALGVG